MGLAEDIESRARPMVEAAGLEWVDVQFRAEEMGWVLRFFIDKPGGFGLSDCQEWSDRLGQMVEESGLLTRGYVLEVSSPGLARPLKKAEDFERFTGIEAVVKTHEPIGNQRNFHGRIERMEGNQVALMDRTNGLVRIPITEIISARLDPDIAI